MKFPAVATVHTPNGPVHCCEDHCRKLLALMRFMGCHVGTAEAPDDSECSNCINENRTELGKTEVHSK